jgi:hypothetical protein
MTGHFGGWWRLWVVLAVIYAGLVAIYTWTSWPEVSRTAHHPAFIYQMSPEARAVIDRPKTLAELEQALIAADRAGSVEKARGFAQEILRIRKRDNWEDAPIVLEMPNGHQLHVAGDTKPEQTTLIGREYTRVLQAATTEAKMAAVGNALLIWLIPTLVVCVFGLAVAWVFRGFRGGHREP